jgi:hypothetical protein
MARGRRPPCRARRSFPFRSSFTPTSVTSKMEARIRRHYQAISSGKSKASPSQEATTATGNTSGPAKPSPFSFPTPYPAHLAVHTFLVVASFFFLPRSFVLEPHSDQLRNLDRPQHAFLVPLTTRPEITALWTALGNTLLVGWWSGSVREWVRAGKMGLVISERMRDENRSTVRGLTLRVWLPADIQL